MCLANYKRCSAELYLSPIFVCGMGGMNMSNEQSANRRVTVSSGMAFALMPQFKYCFAGLKQLSPLFGITLAIIFSNAGLISKDHPILKNDRSYGIADVMGEAWYTLRTTRATASQWGAFSSVVLFAALFVSAISMFVLRLGLGVGAVAHAQLFQAPGDPYGAGAGKSDIDTMSAAFSGPGNALYDSRFTIPGGPVVSSKDYALMLLDKVLRQSAASTPNGGSLQNALASLMQVYNSGILVVASVMIFWMVMSIVVDTAKTGIVGGNRHNMVWAPIRVVFALGIMIPLGSQGYSSGQYMVMKLAEWGSNFGSQGWSAYVTKVLTGSGNVDSMLLGFQSTNVSSFTSQLSQIMTCAVAYDAYSKQAGADASDQIPLVPPPGPVYQKDIGRYSITYTNPSGGNLCGMVTYAADDPSPSGSTFSGDPNILTYTDPSGNPVIVSASANGMKGGYYGTNLAVANILLGNPKFIQEINKFRDSMTGAIATAMGGGSGSVFTWAQKFACTFVARRFPDPATVGAIAPCGGYTNQCNGSATKDPDDSCQQSMADDITNAMKAAYGTAGPALSANIANTMLQETKDRGWAGMGMWFAQFAAINAQIQAAVQPKVSVTPGTAWKGCGMFSSAGSWIKSWFTGVDKCKDIGKKVAETMSEYDRWWTFVSVNHKAPNSLSAQSGAATVSGSKDDWESTHDAVKGGDSSSALDPFLNKMMPNDATNPFFVSGVADSTKPDSYPMAQLSHIGLTLITSGGVMDAVSTVGQTLGGGVPWVGGGVANLSIWSTMSTIGNMLIMGGMTLLFWLPVMPALRVAMAAMTWITAVFLAVAMVPIAALAHLTSEGDGLAGGARVAWVLWLNVLLRPILVVLGFVGAVLIYNAFAIYFTNMFGGIASMSTETSGIYKLVGYFAFSAIYALTLYSAANAAFKMLDLVPDAMMTYMGQGGAAASFDHAHGHAHGHLGAGAQAMVGGMLGAKAGGGGQRARDGSKTADIRHGLEDKLKARFGSTKPAAKDGG